MTERETLEKIGLGLAGFWEYICRVTNDVPFTNGDWSRGGRMLIFMLPPPSGFNFTIDAERLWSATDPDGDTETPRTPLLHSVPWRGEGVVLYRDRKLRFEYFPEDASGSGVTKDTIQLVHAADGLYVGLGEFSHLHVNGTTSGVVELRKMDHEDDFRFAPRGIRPAGTVAKLSDRARLIPKETTEPAPHTLNVAISNGNLIVGSGNVIDSTAADTTGPIHVPIIGGNILSLLDAMRALRIPPADLTELETVIADDEPQQGRLGAGIASWIGRMVTKGLTGTWEVGKDVSAALLTEIFLRYYGLKK